MIGLYKCYCSFRPLLLVNHFSTALIIIKFYFENARGNVVEGLDRLLNYGMWSPCCFKITVRNLLLAESWETGSNFTHKVA